MAAAVVVSCAASPASAESFLGVFRDPTDGWVDSSNWLLNKRGFMPVPIIITEPAIGYGGGAALLFFHKTKQDEERAESGEPLGLPPSVSSAFGGATENGTWFAGGGNFTREQSGACRCKNGAVITTKLPCRVVCP